MDRTIGLHSIATAGQRGCYDLEGGSWGELGRCLLSLVSSSVVRCWRCCSSSLRHVAFYLVLVVPPLFGCLSYSDRPGPGCYGLSSRVGLAEIAFVWPAAFLCVLLALLTKRR